MPERILHLDKERIELLKTVAENEAQIHTGIETLAQTGAFHLRHRCGLDRHAFLLKIDRYHSRELWPTPGCYTVQGHLVGGSSQAFAYDLSAILDDTTCFEGRFLFALRDYDQAFQREVLETHYRKLLSCLKNDTPGS